MLNELLYLLEVGTYLNIYNMFGELGINDYTIKLGCYYTRTSCKKSRYLSLPIAVTHGIRR